MKAFTTVLSVAEIHAARAFYEDLFGLELYQDYGRNLTFTCGLSLQQDFHWLTGLSRAARSSGTSLLIPATTTIRSGP